MTRTNLTVYRDETPVGSLLVAQGIVDDFAAGKTYNISLAEDGSIELQPVYTTWRENGEVAHPPRLLGLQVVSGEIEKHPRFEPMPPPSQLVFPSYQFGLIEAVEVVKRFFKKRRRA